MNFAYSYYGRFSPYLFFHCFVYFCMSNIKPEVIPKPHLRLNGCVAPRIKMLTYYRVRSAFNPRGALPLSLI